MKTKRRIYLVMICGEPRLIDAVNQATARGHVNKDSVTVEVASQGDLVDLIGKGVKVEYAGDDTLGGFLPSEVNTHE